MAASRKRVRQPVHPHARKRVRHVLADYADADTPEDIKVDSTTQRLLIWAVGRFGIGIVFAGMTYVLYQDQRKDQQRLFDIIVHSNQIMQENTKTMADLKRLLENNHN